MQRALICHARNERKSQGFLTDMPDTRLSVYESGEYLDANPDWHMEDSAWKAANIGEMLKRESVSFADGRGSRVRCRAYIAGTRR